MRKLVERSALMGMGLLSMTRKKATRIMDDISKHGVIQKNETKEWVEKLVNEGEEERQALQNMIDDAMKKSFHEMNLATKMDVDALTARIAKLEKKKDFG